jgi:hypothetical protein
LNTETPLFSLVFYGFEAAIFAAVGATMNKERGIAHPEFHRASFLHAQ